MLTGLFYTLFPSAPPLHRHPSRPLKDEKALIEKEKS